MSHEPAPSLVVGALPRPQVPVLNGAWNASPSTELTNGDIVSFEHPSHLSVPDLAARGGVSGYGSSRAGLHSQQGLASDGSGLASGAEGLAGSELQQRAQAYLARRQRQVAE